VSLFLLLLGPKSSLFVTSHKKYGEAIAINAGTAAYFIACHILVTLTPDMPLETRNKVYEFYFLTLRAGHAGRQ
jgi:hypothetical protein